MTPSARKFALTAHVVCSVGWLGAVVGFLCTAIVGFTSEDAQLVRAAFRVMEPSGWFVLVPLSVGSLLTGLIQSLGTPWGLFQHYWVLFKLLINVLASVVLLLYMGTLGYLADTAAATPLSEDVPAVLRSGTAIIHAAAALLLLLVATVLSVYKPQGLTPYGLRRQRERRARERA